MNVVYLLLGSNLDDRSALLEKARQEISTKIGRITRQSSVYESEPWGFHADQAFLNQVIRIESALSPSYILRQILAIETVLGRKRPADQRFSSRLIDIDILFYNDEIIEIDNLVIPHKGIPDRMFTLIPLSELDGSFIHPGSHKTITELINDCKDQSTVHPYHPASS
jgi:2-amino-4-hydroxy-6-hydroxymethyldihydropteridine diphosphokinase